MGAGKTIAPGDFPRQEVVIDLLSFGDNLAHPAAGKQVIAMRVGNFKLTYATPASAIGVTTVIPHTVRIILMVYIIRGAYGGHQPFVESRDNGTIRYTCDSSITGALAASCAPPQQLTN